MSRQAQQERQYRELERAQRRRLWLSVLLPFSFVLAVAVAFVGIALSLRSPAQLAILSNAMLTVLLLCPLVIIMFPLTILSFGLVALASRWRSKSRSPLRRLEAWTAVVEQNAEGWLGQVDERVLNWAVRLAPVRELLMAFEAPESKTPEEGES
ncbi:MAG: hypothetical protein J4G18_08265 [Anaerolineae bacterium]|nr:hypothetical protein [Anaerolineae bacterium]